MPNPIIPSNDDDYTRAFAEETLAADDLSDRDRDRLLELMLDHLGCCYRGAHLPWGRSMHAWAREHAVSGPAIIFGSRLRTGASAAAFVNATAAHGLELDDTHDESISHPGAVVTSTALAVAVESGNDAARLLTAIRAGYEVAARVGAATNAAHVVEHGIHPTSLFTGFGAVAATAMLRGLDTTALLRAWGLMLSMAGGSMQFSQEPVGTTVKRLHGGLAAFHGVLACDLVALGIEGPERALDGRYGLVSIFGRDPDRARLVEMHPDGPEIHRVSFKPYPCCRFFHSTIDALRDVTESFTVDPAAIRRFTIGGPRVLEEQHTLRRPESEMAAQYSLPFAIGAALTFGPASVDGYDDAALRNTGILDIADRVTVVHDARLQAAFPAHFGSWLEIELDDGTRRRAEVRDSVGTPANPMSRQQLTDKFDGLVTPVNDRLRGADILKQLEALSTAQDIRGLLDRFADEA